MRNVVFSFLAGLIMISMATSCNDDPNDDHEQELITTLIYTLTPVGGGTPVIMSFVDPDGDGGVAPVITTTGTLVSGKSYEGQIVVRNDSAMPPETITVEIKEEADEHQFFFQTSGGVVGKMGFTYADIDKNGKPVGLETDVIVSGGPASGNVKLILRHQLNKNGTGVSTGDITNAGGETDIEVEFGVVIQ